jgi:hypothetical protein
MKVLAASTLLAAGLASAPTLYAHESDGSGRIGQTSEMMVGCSEMMVGCSEMMQSMRQGGSGSPNDQWRQGTPDAAPSEKG